MLALKRLGSQAVSQHTFALHSTMSAVNYTIHILVYIVQRLDREFSFYNMIKVLRSSLDLKLYDSDLNVEYVLMPKVLAHSALIPG